MDSGNAQENQPTRIQFRNFDVVLEATDHHYLKFNKSNTNQWFNGNTSVHAKIMKEWKILEKNLPESIYVRVYETRIDLLRAVIIGPAGTPYHDGLFFFDIVLPYDYPIHPPKVYYHSHGFRLNPNLYANGTVCLSLINTWSGSRSEKWTQTSTILQILVSIQGLVLNERPYFNEPGYAPYNRCSKWVERSIGYNQDAFILSCKTMLQIMRKPPQNFENFVVQHFSQHAASILAAIKDYQKGLRIVGQFEMNKAGSSSSSLVKVPSKFKFNLERIEPDLKKALNRKVSEAEKLESNSAIVNKNEENGTSETGKTVKPKEDVKQHKNGLLGKLICFAKWICE